MWSCGVWPVHSSCAGGRNPAPPPSLQVHCSGLPDRGHILSCRPVTAQVLGMWVKKLYLPRPYKRVPSGGLPWSVELLCASSLPGEPDLQPGWGVLDLKWSRDMTRKVPVMSSEVWTHSSLRYLHSQILCLLIFYFSCILSLAMKRVLTKVGITPALAICKVLHKIKVRNK